MRGVGHSTDECIRQSPKDIEPVRDRLWLAVAAFLAGYQGQSRVHAESDLRSYQSWCQARHLDPLAAERVHIELFMRWMQEVRCYKPSTVSRRLSVMAGFYRTCVTSRPRITAFS